MKEKQRLVVFQSPMISGNDYFIGARITICSTPVNFPFRHYSTCRRRDADLSELYRDAVVSRKNFTARGMKIERIETKSTYSTDFYYYARISYRGLRFFITGSFTKHLNVDRYAPVFDRMLASFRPLLKSERRVRPRILLRPTAKHNNGMQRTRKSLILMQGLSLAAVRARR